VNGFRRQFHHWYFWTAASRQCDRGISIYQQIQLYSTDAQAQWPVSRSWLYGGATVISCTSRLVRYWLCKRFQPTIRCWYTAKYMPSPSFTPPQLSEWVIFTPRITTGTSFERNSCPRHVQKYQINLTQRCISRFPNAQLWTAIPYTNWRRLGTWS